MSAVRTAALCCAVALILAACGHSRQFGGEQRGEEATPTYPENYKADILADLRVYLVDPTHIREALIAEPVVRTVGRGGRYVVCLRFNPRSSGGVYSGSKTYLATFSRGRFEQMSDQVKDECAGAAYQPFPELEALTR